MSFFSSSLPSPVVLPDGPRVEHAVYTGTACLALMDSAVTGEVWEDLLFDGVVHDHGAGGLMLNSASVGTHLEHDGDFPVETVLDDAGKVVAFRVNIDPYAEDLSDVRDIDGHGLHDFHGHDHHDLHDHVHAHDGSTHSHPHGHDHDHEHEHDEETGHGHGGHVDGWSNPVSVRLVSDRAMFGDPAGLPEADDTGDLIDFEFPAAGGLLTLSVLTDAGLRREVRGVWTA